MPGQLQHELQQARPFRSLEEEALVSLARTMAVYEHALGAVFAEFGITTTQYNVLRILKGAGAAGLCRTEIGRRMVNQVPDVTRMLDRLEDAGWIARARESDDRRFVTARITRAGLKLLADMDSPLQRFLKSRLGHLSPDQLVQLIDTLARLREPATGR